MGLLDIVADAVRAVPWWIYLLVALAAAPAGVLAAAAALGVGSATGAHHHALTPRQRRLGRWGFVAALLAVPGSAVLGLASLAAMLWVLFG